MLLKVGDYSYQLYGAGITVDRRDSLNDVEQPIERECTVNVMTRLLNTGGTVASMNTLVEAFEAAHRIPNQDVILYQADGTTPTVHSWPASDQIVPACVIRGPSYPEYQGAEGINYRTIQVSFRIIEQLPEATSSLRSYTQTVTVSGGGPRVGHIETLTGRPQKQLIRQATTAKASQNGSAVGIFAYPFPPEPLWPEALVELGRFSYQKSGRNWITSWQYEFESDAQRYSF